MLQRWQPVPTRLFVAWLLVGVAGYGLIAVAVRTLPADWITSRSWLLVTAVWFYLWLFTGWHLPNHEAVEPGQIAAGLGLGNLLTLGRGWLISLLAGFLLGPEPIGLGRWLPVVAYTASDIADYFDGYLARRQGLATNLGSALDLELDGLGLLVAVAVAIHFGALPWWFIVFGAARYAYTLLIRLRRLFDLPVHELGPSQSRRPIAGLTMGYVSASLWPILDPPELTLAGLVFMLPFLASFSRDGMVVAGKLDPTSPGYLRWRQRIRTLSLDWLPLAFRVGVFYLAALEVPMMFRPSEGLLALFPAVWLWQILAILLLLGSLAIVFGWAGRFAAFAALFPFGFVLAAGSLTPARIPALLSLLAILFLGTGRYSLWKPSDEVFARRAGEVPD